MEDLKEEIRNFVLENYYFNHVGTLGNEDSFIERGTMDSTGVLELVSFLEEKYSIEIEMDELIPENLDSVRRLTHFVSKKLTQTVQRSGPGSGPGHGA